MTRSQAVKLIFVLVVLPFLVAGTAAVMTLPLIPHPVDQTNYTVSRGSGLRMILNDAHRQGIIRTPRLTEWMARATGRTQPKAGTYRLPSNASDWRIVNMLHSGHVATTSVTVLEGWTSVEIAQMLDASGVVSGQDFLKASTDTVLLQRYGIVATEVEGYLFPETYRFAFGLDGRTVADVMLRTFFSKIPATYATMAEQANLGLHDAVILASIIQKESFVPPEMPTVSSVYHNRLRRSMRLQADPTVIYRMPGYRGDITYQMLRTPTPYNTYTIHGLPAGPIGNPGLDALLAAVKPEKTNYLFLVSRGDGTHDFSETYAEHRRKIVEYGLLQRRPLPTD